MNSKFQKLNFRSMSLVLLAVLAACSHGSSVSQNPVQILKRLSEDTEIAFPAGSKLLEFYEKDIMFNPTWVAKIGLPDDGAVVPAIKETLLKKAAPFPPSPEPSLGPTVAWWNPQAPILVQTFETSDNSSVLAFLCIEGKSPVLYLEWTSP